MLPGDNVSEHLVSVPNWLFSVHTRIHKFGSFRCSPHCLLLVSPPHSDKVLEKTSYALRKLDLFEIDVLASACPLVLRKIQNVCLLCGYNKWTTVPAQIMGFARRLKYEFRGRIPTDAYILCTFLGVNRKVCMLILQDAFFDNRKYTLEVQAQKVKGGLVCDRHVLAFGKSFGLTKHHGSLSMAARDMESWLVPMLWKEFNESVGGIRQLYSDTETAKKMEAIAEKLGMLDFLRKATRNTANRVAVKEEEIS